MKVIELHGAAEYARWMDAHRDVCKVLQVVVSNQRSSAWTGVLGSAFPGERHYTVSYEEVPPPRGQHADP